MATKTLALSLTEAQVQLQTLDQVAPSKARKILDKVETTADLDELTALLDEIDEMERSDYDSAAEYRKAREEAWDNFIAEAELMEEDDETEEAERAWVPGEKLSEVRSVPVKNKAEKAAVEAATVATLNKARPKTIEKMVAEVEERNEKTAGIKPVSVARLQEIAAEEVEKATAANSKRTAKKPATVEELNQDIDLHMKRATGRLPETTVSIEPGSSDALVFTTDPDWRIALTDLGYPFAPKSNTVYVPAALLLGALKIQSNPAGVAKEIMDAQAVETRVLSREERDAKFKKERRAGHMTRRPIETVEPVDERSETRKFRSAASERLAARRGKQDADERMVERVERPLKTRKDTSDRWTAEAKAATANRLWTARAAKYGLTIDELKSLHLRSGVAPSKEQMAQIEAARKADVADRQPVKRTVKRSK